MSIQDFNNLADRVSELEERVDKFENVKKVSVSRAPVKMRVPRKSASKKGKK